MDDFGNVTNLASNGFVYVTPERRDGIASLMLDPVSVRASPVFTCMSVIKASIKIISFHSNSTSSIVS